MDFSPDGVRLAIASLDSLKVYELGDGSVSFRADLSSSVSDVLFAQDGNRLAVALGDDGLVILDVERPARPEVAYLEGDWSRLAQAKGSNAIVGYDRLDADLNQEAASWSGDRTQSLPTERLIPSLVFGNDAEVLAQLQQPALDFHRTTNGLAGEPDDATPSRAAALYWRLESQDFMLGYFDLVAQQMMFGERLDRGMEPRILDFRETSIGPRILLWLRDGVGSRIALIDPMGTSIPFEVSSDQDRYQRYSAGAISADGSLVALHKRDGAIEVFATADAKATAVARLTADAVTNAAPALAPKTGHARPIAKVVASPDNSLLATVGSLEQGLNLWDRQSGYQLRTLAADETVTAFDFSHDGKTVLVVGLGDGIDLRRVADGSLQQTLLHSQTQMAAFIDDRDTILACGTADCTIGTPKDFVDGTAAILERPDRFGWAGFLAGDVSADGSYAGMLMHDGRWLIVDLRNLKMAVPAPIPEAASLAIGADGRGLVATKDGLLHLIDFETGNTVLRMYAGAGGQVDVAAIGGSRYIVRTPGKRDRSGEWTPAASRILDTSTLLFSDPLPVSPSFGDAPYAGPMAVSPDGEELFFVSHRGVFEPGWAHIDIFDLGRHSWESSIATDGSMAANSVVFAGTGDRLIVNGHQTAVTWDLRTGRTTRQRPSKFYSRTISVADYSFYMDDEQELESSPTIFSPQTGARSVQWLPPPGWDDGFGQAARWNGSQALFYDHGLDTTRVTLFELNEAALASAVIRAQSLELPRTPELSLPELHLAPDGRSLLSVDRSRLRVFETKTGTLLWELTSEPNGAWFEEAAFSEDGARVYLVKSFGPAVSLDSGDGTVLGEIAGGEILLSVSELGTAMPVRVEDTRLSIVNSRSDTASASVGRQGVLPRFVRRDRPSNLVLIAGSDARNLLWRPADDSVFTIDAAIAGPDGVAFSPDGGLMALVEEDGTVSLWKTSDGERLARLAAMRNGDWAVVGEDGRYDASNPGDLPSLGWVLPEEPLRVVPLELFFQEYFEPALLPRLLEGEPFGTLPEIRDINRLQPLVRIVSIEPDPAKEDAVRIRIEVAEGTRGDVRSGVRAVKLFRDDQIVAQVDLAEFNSDSGQQMLEFDGILLPHDRDSVEFSAYAFNDDWIT
ncbi:MAG: WD40 repeat domain-containing protein, partial [Hyphomonas sp.]|nr:WD40 repeat domain-containing protein [Hyphomonas sp.]